MLLFLHVQSGLAGLVTHCFEFADCCLVVAGQV
jgi:hypothetical protein